MRETKTDQGTQVIRKLISRYPQLTLEPAEGLKDTEEYRRIVRNGYRPEVLECRFRTSEQDTCQEIATPAGNAETVCLSERADFERAVRILAYRGENTPIPPSMGAVTIRGIVNWTKIQEHKKEYLASGNLDWSAEFRRFTAVPENYKDTLILISRGPYSGLPWQETGWEEEEWVGRSEIIRTYHELAHFVSGILFPEHKETLRDEVIADCIGLYQATGAYDGSLSGKFLGLEGSAYRKGGRLENYVTEEFEKNCDRAERLIAELENYCTGYSGSCFQLLEELERKRIGMED